MFQWLQEHPQKKETLSEAIAGAAAAAVKHTINTKSLGGGTADLRTYKKKERV